MILVILKKKRLLNALDLLIWMRRKLIQQGGGGLTLYLPKKWLDAQSLKAGDEVGIEVFDSELKIAPANVKEPKKTLELHMGVTRESAVRTFILNAYRLGYDKIIVTYPGKLDEITGIADKYLIGFEVIEQEGKFVLESVSEPSYENFEVIIQRQFYMLGGMMHDLKDKQAEAFAARIYRYDSFLKRCISKGVFSHDAKLFVWQFLSDFLQISRLCLFCHREISAHGLICSKEEKEMLDNILEMFELLKSAYFKLDALFIEKLHTKEEFLRKKGVLILRKRDPVLLHYLMMIARQVYICGSPLEGILQAKKSGLKKIA